MSTSITDNQFTFALPSLTYIDTSLEEPFIRDETRAARSGGFIEWLAARIQAFRAWREENRVLAELSLMTDHDLMDIGLTRSDVGRVFNGKLNRDLTDRGQRL